MHISMTELKASLRRCFEALDYFIGNYEDAADMIIWMQVHGLNGLSEFEKSLPFLQADSSLPEISISYEDNISANIDCHGRSAFNCISAAMDLANSKALTKGLASVTLHNCNNRMFVLKALADAGKLGLSASAYWQNETCGNKHIEYAASIKAGSSYPDLSSAICRATEPFDAQTITIICSSRVNLACQLREKNNTLEINRYSAEDFNCRKLKSIEDGLDVNEQLWQKINAIGASVLVENSERSRCGAGE